MNDRWMNLDNYLGAAQRHGEAGEIEDGATHEVGDLQALLLACWDVMTDDQKHRAFADPGVKDVLAGPEYDGDDVSDTHCIHCGDELDYDCDGEGRCPTCDEPCPRCHDGGGPS